MIHRSHCNIQKIHHHPYSQCTVKCNLILYCQLLATIPKQHQTPLQCASVISANFISVIGHEADSMHNLGAATYSLQCTFNCCTQAPTHEHAHNISVNFLLQKVKETSSISLAWKVFHRKVLHMTSNNIHWGVRFLA